MKKLLGIVVLGLFLNTNVLAGIKNIGNKLSINIPNNFKYFELTFRQLVSRFPDISDEFIYEDFGIGMGSKLIVIANNKKTINFFNDVTTISGLEKLNRKHIQPIIKKFSSESFLKKILKDLQKMYPNKNFNTMSEDQLIELMADMYEDPKMIRKFEKIFKPFINKFNKEYKLERYTVLILGDKPADQLVTELNSLKISEMKDNIYDWLDELYEEYKDPSFRQLKNWEFEIARNHKGNLYLYSDKSMQSPYVSNRYEQELFMTTKDNKIFVALSICAKNCNGNTDFLELIEPTDLYVKSNHKNKNNSDNDNIVNQLEQLNSLYKSGVLTKEEFEKAKKKILN